MRITDKPVPAKAGMGTGYRKMIRKNKKSDRRFDSIKT